jgi:PTH1 family peptidyl-tRNA hydrolase
LLVVGLGNPGREYAGNRHNLGYMVVDELARRHGGTFRGKFSGRLAEVRLGGGRVALLKPETYMNESGVSVGAAARFFRLEPAEVLVVHDEGDFELGRIQARLGGGLAGHNGLRSIAQHLRTQDFLRLRVGVGRPERGDRRPLADWVLADFEPHEDAEAIVARAADAAETIVGDGLDEAQRRYNERP